MENELKLDEIDNILDEIEENENTQNVKKNDMEIENDIEWNDILKLIRTRNINSIKNLINSKQINVNTQNHENGRTLLIYSVIIGDIDLVKTVCNFGGDVHIKDDDGLDALDYAIKYGRYKITELVYYRQLSGSLGNDLKNISIAIHAKNKEAEFILESEKEEKFYSKFGSEITVYDKRGKQCNDYKLSEKMINFMISAIKKRAPFDETMFYYSWYFESKKNAKKLFFSPLWETMMSVYKEILSNTKDKNGWKWLKEHFINSLIWYLPHPSFHATQQQNSDNNNDAERKEMKDNDNANRMDEVLRKTMFYELLKRVKNESMNQSNLLLKTEIDSIKNEKPNEWKQLIAYNVNTKHSKNARQDLCGCLTPKYDEADLSENKYPPTIHFSASKHYDTNIYLNELMFRANIINDLFQNDMKMITKEINQETGDTVQFRMGPIKTLARSQTKVENDYINEDYPRSAKILDINRCALQFESIPSMMNFIQIFTKKVNDKNSGSITEIIRSKNGWSIYDPQYPQYTDIKLNVLVKSEFDGSIICEIQFLLDLMSKFKKVAHKLYSVERKFELVYNHQLLNDDMKSFKDIEDINTVWMQIVNDDDVNYFGGLWESNASNIELLLNKSNMNVSNISNHLMFTILISKTGKIDNYLKQKSKKKKIYRETILYFFNNQINLRSNDWDLFLKDIGESNKCLFVERLFDLFDDNEQLTEFILFKQWNGLSLFQSLCKNGDIKPLIYMLYNKRISDNAKCKSLTNKCPSDFNKTLQGLKNEMNHDQEILDKFSIIYDVCINPLVFQHKAFNYYTLKTPLYHDTEFKFVDDTDNDKLYCFGLDGQYSSYGRLGLGDDYKGKQCATPTFCGSFIETSTYSDHSLGIDINGTVFSWGSNKRGQLGLGDQNNTCIPHLLPSFTKALHVAVGKEHSMILTDDGNIWSFGGGGEYQNHGQLGHEDAMDIMRPKLIEKLKDIDIVHISCGDRHSMAISRDGILFSFGHNFHGECGLPKDKINITSPTRVTLPNSLIPLYTDCGGWHTLILSINGVMLSCGNGKYGRLGYSNNNNNQYTPKVIEALKTENIINIAAGQDHSLCITENGDLYTFGRGDNGRLGHGNQKNQDIPKKVEFFSDRNIKIKSCKGGLNHSGAITSKNELYLFGNGEKGQLSQQQNMEKNTLIPTKIEYFNNMEIKALSLGQFWSGIITKKSSSNLNEEETKNNEETEYILTANREINIKNKIKNNLVNKSHQIWIKNIVLFGNLGWILIQKNAKYSPFPRFTTTFMDHLKIINNKTIELVDYDIIHEIYHLEILMAKYAVLINSDKAEIKQEYIENNNGELYDFSANTDIKTIRFKIPSSNKKESVNVSVYIQPQNNLNFLLLKQFGKKQLNLNDPKHANTSYVSAKQKNDDNDDS